VVARVERACVEAARVVEMARAHGARMVAFPRVVETACVQVARVERS
jgi:hypothetical protein